MIPNEAKPVGHQRIESVGCKKPVLDTIPVIAAPPSYLLTEFYLQFCLHRRHLLTCEVHCENGATYGSRNH